MRKRKIILGISLFLTSVPLIEISCSKTYSTLHQRNNSNDGVKDNNKINNDKLDKEKNKNKILDKDSNITLNKNTDLEKNEKEVKDKIDKNNSTNNTDLERNKPNKLQNNKTISNNTQKEIMLSYNYDLTEPYIYKTPINIKNLSEFDENNELFKTYNNWLISKSKTNYKNSTIDKRKYLRFELKDSKFSNNSLELIFKINYQVDNLNRFKLIYTYGENNIREEINLDNIKIKNKIFSVKISNLEKNKYVKLIDIKNENKSFNFISENEIILFNKSSELSDDIIITNNTRWETWELSQNLHTFSLFFSTKNGQKPEFRKEMRLVTLKNNGEIKYFNFNFDEKIYSNPKNSNIKITKIKANTEEFDPRNIDRILGIEIKNNENVWSRLDKIPKINIKGKVNFINNKPIINKINYNNSKLEINFSDTNIKNIEIEVKSLDPFTNFSNIYKLDINNNNWLEIQDISLPEDITKFIITKIGYKDQLWNYEIDENNVFNNLKNIKNFEISKFDIFLSNKNIYGSIMFDFKKEELELFKNKNLELIFERKTKIMNETNNQSIYHNLFLDKNKVIVPFTKLKKFTLNGFYENTEYELKEIKIVDKYTLNEFLGSENFKNSLSKLKNKSFLFNFEYDNTDNNFIYGEIEGETKNNLFKKESSNDKNIEYKIQNHYAIVNYNKEKWYKRQASLYENSISKELKEKLSQKTNSFNLVKNGQKVETHFISPREIINDLDWKINDEFTKASITKDLSQFHNLDKHIEDSFLEIGFEFDPKQRQIIDLIEPEPYVRYLDQAESYNTSQRNMSKSFVYISVPYKEILKKPLISNLSFEYLAIRNSKEEEFKLKQLINDKYKFSVEFNKENNKLTYNIESKDPSTKIFDRLGDHYLSSYNSSFIGSSLFFVHWADLDINNKSEIKYVPKGKSNILSVNLEQLNFKDNYIHLNNDATKSSKRTYFNNAETNILNARNRVFNFAPWAQSGQGTWDIIGKVNPNDPHDYKFFITTNQHVWGESLSKEFKNNVLNLPIEVFEPDGGWNIKSTDKRGSVFDDKKWLNETIKVDIIANFHNDKAFPNSEHEFKNNYGNINFNSTWNIYAYNTNNSLSNADLIVGIADFKDFYLNFSEKNEKLFYTSNRFDKTDKKTYNTFKFFKKLKKLKNIKPSKHNLHISRLVNFNWSLAAFPISEQKINADTINRKRYREYIIGNISNDDILRLGYGGAKSKLPVIPLNSLIFDLQSGSSGSMVFDLDGNATGLVTEASFTHSNIMIIDTNANAFLGDGYTTQNPGSFYERMRLLSYLYPDKYDNSEFKTLPNWEKLNDE
ncbi:hypothetical protein JXZ92_02605 [Mycoplasma sp. CSL10137]|uniref:hypothetical protein n=1 Tax=Mycoplasma sp. CSL10137 TaxID=2813824 RepID=UPI00197BA2C1|nr:hypothetical protein [Mycoplasma sp. CSL10137]MBN4083700.1 hypothetical protein [Mycoplasma sp. CSL10137]